jgi:glycosyltransferase involved in cell wall biosynthesis
MKISIVTPSLNQGRFLREALESVRLQAYPCVEHLVMDGGSQDETLPVLRCLADSAEWTHLHWISRPDGGQSDALNHGFEEASGDIVGWLNSDDRYRADCFRHVVDAFAANPDLDVLYGDFAMMNEAGVPLKVRREIDFNPFILLYHRVSYIPTPATFFRRRVFDDGHRLQPGLHYAMDYEFFLRLADAGYRIGHIPQLLADFRLHPASKSCSKEVAQAEEKRKIMWSFSPIGAWAAPPFLRKAAFAGMEWTASMMRYSEKMRRGYYFAGKTAKGGLRSTLPPIA